MTLDLLTQICQVWTGIALLTFVLLQFVTAPYGRHIQNGWGIVISNKLGWILMEFPSFAIILYFYLISSQSMYASVLSGIWLIHYFNRTFIYPFRIRTLGKKMPLIIMGSAIFFNTINASLNGYFLSHFEQYQNIDFISFHFIIGMVLFIVGLVLNQISDSLLINLRKPGEKGYKIPRGFLFKYVSCPNHLSELIQWSGFALMAWNLPALSFLVWTFANLFPRAIKHHRWYKSHFANYPKDRKAIIPGMI